MPKNCEKIGNHHDKITKKLEKANSTWVQAFKNRFSSTDVQKNKRNELREQLEKEFNVWSTSNVAGTKRPMKSDTGIELPDKRPHLEKEGEIR